MSVAKCKSVGVEFLNTPTDGHALDIQDKQRTGHLQISHERTAQDKQRTDGS